MPKHDWKLTSSWLKFVLKRNCIFFQRLLWVQLGSKHMWPSSPWYRAKIFDMLTLSVGRALTIISLSRGFQLFKDLFISGSHCKFDIGLWAKDAGIMSWWPQGNGSCTNERHVLTCQASDFSSSMLVNDVQELGLGEGMMMIKCRLVNLHSLLTPLPWPWPCSVWKSVLHRCVQLLWIVIVWCNERWWWIASPLYYTLSCSLLQWPWPILQSMSLLFILLWLSQLFIRNWR